MKDTDDFNEDNPAERIDTEMIIDENEGGSKVKKIISLIIIIGIVVGGIVYLYTLPQVKNIFHSLKSSFSKSASSKKVDANKQPSTDLSPANNEQPTSEDNRSTAPSSPGTPEVVAATLARPPLNTPAWDLNDVYKSMQEKDIETDFQTIENIAKEIKNANFKKLNAQSLLALLKKEDQALELILKISQYIDMKVNLDTTNPEAQLFQKTNRERIVNMLHLFNLFESEMAKTSNESFEQMIKQANGLKVYHNYFKKIKSYNNSQSLDANALWISKTEHYNREAWHDMYMKLLNDDYSGNAASQKDLNHYRGILSTATDKKDRDAAVLALYNALKKVYPLYETILYSLVRSENYDNFAHKYYSIWRRAEVSGSIKGDVLQSLLAMIQQHGPNIYFKYSNLRSKLLGINTIDYADLKAPIPILTDKFYTWEEGRDLTLNTYSLFAPKLTQIAAKFFVNPWIDAKVGPNKTSTPHFFSMTPNLHPYILLTYTGDMDSLISLTEQVSAGVHQSLSSEKNIRYFSVPTPMLNITSAISTRFLYKNLLSTSVDRVARISLMFDEVERLIKALLYDARLTYFKLRLLESAENGDIAKNSIDAIWMESGVKINGLSYEHERYNWIIEPQIFSFGSMPLHNSLAVLVAEAVSKRIDSLVISDFESKYLKLLQEGNIDCYKQLASLFDIDMASPQFWESALLSVVSKLEVLDQEISMYLTEKNAPPTAPSTAPAGEGLPKSTPEATQPAVIVPFKETNANSASPDVVNANSVEGKNSNTFKNFDSDTINNEATSGQNPNTLSNQITGKNSNSFNENASQSIVLDKKELMEEMQKERNKK